VADAIQTLLDLGLSLDAFKDHVMSLMLDQRRIDAFNELSPPIKANLTKTYNLIVKSSVKSSNKGRDK
jgi:hypothetical protein